MPDFSGDTRSERLSWSSVVAMAEGIQRQMDKAEAGDRRALQLVSRYADAIVAEAKAMHRQVSSGIHANPGHRRNPPLMLYGNPPMRVRRRKSGGTLGGGMVRLDYYGTLSEEVHAITYTHLDDGQDYKHDFDPGVELVAATLGGKRVAVVSRPDGKPVWEDF